MIPNQTPEAQMAQIKPWKPNGSKSNPWKPKCFQIKPCRPERPKSFQIKSWNDSKSSPRGPNRSKSRPEAKQLRIKPWKPKCLQIKWRRHERPRSRETSGMLPEAVLQDHSKGIRLPEGSQKPFYKGTSRRLGRGFQKVPRKRFTAILKG